MKCIVLCFVFLYCLEIAKSELNSQCTTPDNKLGRCKQFSKCDDLYKLYKTQNMSPQQLKFLQASQCGFLVEALVCCSPLLSVGSNQFCAKIQDVDKIVGGVNTTIDEYRWMAQLEYTDKIKKTTERGCAGSIISRRYILTAAHCLVGLGNQQLTSVILGEWDTTTDPDTSMGITADPIKIYKVAKFIVHEDYNRQKNFENDIGLVKVTSDIVFTKWITPICVPNSEELKNRDYKGFEVVVSGWGRTSPRKNAPSSKLKLKADIEGKSNQECQADYDSIRGGVTITDKQFCAGKEGVDSCRGDSGGPVISVEQIGETIYTYLAGIVSYGPTACGQGAASGVYTKVAAYIPWIEANTL